MTIVDFLLARVAEDEDVAQKAAAGLTRMDQPDLNELVHWCARNGDVYADWTRIIGSGDGGLHPLTARHIAHYDPARVLAECQAKRAIIELYQQSKAEAERPYALVTHHHVGVHHSIRYLAAVYADHPDYDEAWRPI